MKKILYILAPNDRFNYGDLLFPYIIRHYFNDIVDEMVFCSTIKSDLSKLGGIKTNSVNTLYQVKNDNENILIVGGGDSLCIDWITILSFLDKKIDYISAFDHKFHTKLLAQYINLKYKPKTKFPFSIGKNELTGFKHILYNSLGGTSLSMNSELWENDAVHKILSSVDYISVRESSTNLRLLNNGIKNHLVPDSAILLSEVFHDRDIIDKLSPEVQSISNDKYIFFQINLKLLNSNEIIYSELLNKISKEENVKICLCPIGTARGHSDDIALSKIKKHLYPNNHYFIKSPSIWDIMWLIKNSKLYVGSSLHGTITSMSYGVPFVVYGPEKLRIYIETWAKDMGTLFSAKEMLYKNIIAQLNCPIIHNPYIQKQAVLTSFERMKKLIKK